MIDSGCERVSFETSRAWRWWVTIQEPLERVQRIVAPFRNRADQRLPGMFRFARGGRCHSEAECRAEIEAALVLAKAELREMVLFRPTVALAADGSLTPIGGDDPGRALGSGS